MPLQLAPVPQAQLIMLSSWLWLAFFVSDILLLLYRMKNWIRSMQASWKKSGPQSSDYKRRFVGFFLLKECFWGLRSCEQFVTLQPNAESKKNKKIDKTSFKDALLGKSWNLNFISSCVTKHVFPPKDIFILFWPPMFWSGVRWWSLNQNWMKLKKKSPWADPSVRSVTPKSGSPVPLKDMRWAATAILSPVSSSTRSSASWCRPLRMQQ